MFCVRACSTRQFGPSVLRDTVPLASKSGLADTFAGPLELFLPRTCMRTLSVLGQLPLRLFMALLLLRGKLGSFGSSMHVLMIFPMSPAVFACPLTSVGLSVSPD